LEIEDMRVILFQDKFAELVRSGAKKQTIRVKARCKPGDELSLRKWTGKPYRSKQETLCNSVCTRVQEVRIYEGPATETSEVLARADGFSSHAEMQAWFKNTHGLPFEGQQIEWA
jgi:hypothetical protein